MNASVIPSDWRRCIRTIRRSASKRSRKLPRISRFCAKVDRYYHISPFNSSSRTALIDAIILQNLLRASGSSLISNRISWETCFKILISCLGGLAVCAADIFPGCVSPKCVMRLDLWSSRVASNFHKNFGIIGTCDRHGSGSSGDCLFSEHLLQGRRVLHDIVAKLTTCLPFISGVLLKRFSLPKTSCDQSYGKTIFA